MDRHGLQPRDDGQSFTLSGEFNASKSHLFWLQTA